jgi:hypothetical protein
MESVAVKADYAYQRSAVRIQRSSRHREKRRKSKLFSLRASLLFARRPVKSLIGFVAIASGSARKIFVMNPRASALVLPAYPTGAGHTNQNTLHPALPVGMAESSPGSSPIRSSTFFASSVRHRFR